jgi:hypothetical protein
LIYSILHRFSKRLFQSSRFQFQSKLFYRKTIVHHLFIKTYAAMKYHHSITSKISFMRKILLLLLSTLLLQQATLAQNTWTGSTSTNWSTGTNWNTGHAPTASEDVIISASVNQPLISTAGAVARTVLVQSGTTLTISSAGSLAVNGGSNIAFFNAGTVDNSGQLLIGNLSGSGNYGLRNDATFNNNTGRANHH